MKKLRRERVSFIGISLFEDLLRKVIATLKPTSTRQKKVSEHLTDLGSAARLLPLKALLPVFLFLSASISSPSRTFTSSDGLRTIEATLVAVNEPSQTVTIRLLDGRSFSLKTIRFQFLGSGLRYAMATRQERELPYGGARLSRSFENLFEITRIRSNRLWRVTIAKNRAFADFIWLWPKPFLAWVQGYDQLGQKYKRFNATQVSFDLVHGNWQAWIVFRTDTSTAMRSVTSYLPTGTLSSMTRVNGPLLYKQPQRVVYLNQKQNHKPIVVLPRGPAPAYLNSFGEGLGGSLGGGGFHRILFREVDPFR